MILAGRPERRRANSMPWSFRAAQALHKAGAIVCEGGVPPPEYRLAEMPQRIRHARRPNSTTVASPPETPCHRVPAHRADLSLRAACHRELIVRLQPTQLRLASKRKDGDRLEQAL